MNAKDIDERAMTMSMCLDYIKLDVHGDCIIRWVRTSLSETVEWWWDDEMMRWWSKTCFSPFGTDCNLKFELYTNNVWSRDIHSRCDEALLDWTAAMVLKQLELMVQYDLISSCVMWMSFQLFNIVDEVWMMKHWKFDFKLKRMLRKIDIEFEWF